MKTEHARMCGKEETRRAMLKQVRDLADRYGWAVTYRNGFGDRCITLSMAKGGHVVGMDFDGKSHVGAFLAHWHGDAEYPHDFNLAIRGSINTVHWCKATICDDTFKEFLISLEGGFQRLEATP